ncbi:MAG: FG-GAP-like repeat-containing protein [Chitinophagales bacterium]
MAQTHFEERSQEVGLDFIHHELFLMGGGAAAFDADKDGDEDLYVTGGQGADALFLNDGMGNFTNVSVEYGIEALTKNVVTTSVTTGDIDNDGFREIFVGTVRPVGESSGFSKNLLLCFNIAKQKYEDIAVEVGLYNESFCMGGHFFDANLDGLLDLYVSNYVEVPNVVVNNGQLVAFKHECGRNQLYINSNKRFFSERSSVYGLTDDACTLAATSADMDGDGDADLILANDFGEWIEPNIMYRNDHPSPTFTNISESSGTNAAMYGMGIALGDYDEDLDVDCYVTNIANNRFFENQGDNLFLNKAPQLSIEDVYSEESGNYTTGWGTFFADANNDTYLDLFVANGYVRSTLDRDGKKQKDRLFMGNALHQFEDKSDECGVSFEGLSRGAIHADFNGDGKLDILTVTNEILFPSGTNFLQYYENQSNDQNWIAFRLEGQATNRDAFGTKVLLHAGGRTFLQEVSGGSSHASQNSSILHFGLANLTAVEKVEIFWAGETMETVLNPAINQIHEVLQITEKKERIIKYDSYGIDGLDIRYISANQTLELLFQGQIYSRIELLIYDLSGKLLKQTNLLLQPNEMQILPTESLVNGVFIVQALGREGAVVKRFVNY